MPTRTVSVSVCSIEGEAITGIRVVATLTSWFLRSPAEHHAGIIRVLCSNSVRRNPNRPADLIRASNHQLERGRADTPDRFAARGNIPGRAKPSLRGTTARG